MHPYKTPVSAFAALLVSLAVVGSTRPAQASSSFPLKLQASLQAQFNQSFCVPQCTACHETSTGGFGTLNKFGLNLKAYGMLTPVVYNDNALKTYFEAVAAAKGTGAMPNGDSDGDGVSDADELKAGDSPAIAGPRGQSLLCPDLAYGCGARIAAAPPPPVDRTALLFAGLAGLFGLTLFRRRARARRPAR